MNQKPLREIGQIMADGYPSKDKESTSLEMSNIVEMVLPDLAERASQLLAQKKDKVEEVWQGIKENSEAFFQPALRNIERPKVIYAASKFMNNKLIGTLITKQAIELAQSRRKVNMAQDYFARAREENKLLLLDFGASWCSTCSVVDKTLEKAWPQLEKKFFWAKVDIHQEVDLAERFDILSVPTVLVLTPQEKLLWRKSGTFQIEELLKALNE